MGEVYKRMYKRSLILMQTIEAFLQLALSISTLCFSLNLKLSVSTKLLNSRICLYMHPNLLPMLKLKNAQML